MAKKNEIAKVDTTTIQPVEQIESLILTIRGKQVILDQDLARLYGVETKRLNEQVKRNIERFPEDFMFQLSKEEAESSRSQFATLNEEDELSRSQIATLNGRGHNIKHLPYAFTENGIAMLSGVLRSPMAIATNIHIMRAFNAMRHFIGSHAQVFQRLALSTDKEGVLALANEGHQVMTPGDVIRDPYVLEFTGLPKQKRYKETELEVALKKHMETFLLELGRGFAFIGRQYIIPIGSRRFKIDLVFYHTILKCYLAL